MRPVRCFVRDVRPQASSSARVEYVGCNQVMRSRLVGGGAMIMLNPDARVAETEPFRGAGHEKSVLKVTHDSTSAYIPFDAAAIFCLDGGCCKC